MKVFLALVVGGLCLVGCERTPVDKQGRYVVKVNEQSSVGRFIYIMFDGHEYVKMHHGNNGGICHSPKCWCLEKK